MTGPGNAPVAEARGTEPKPDNKLVEPQERPDTPRAVPSAGDVTDAPDALLDEKQTQKLRTRWSEVQTGFVDEPRKAVEQADELVADAIKRLSQSFTDQRAQLETQWNSGSEASTEDLRQALRRYRSFFDRLLSL